MDKFEVGEVVICTSLHGRGVFEAEIVRALMPRLNSATGETGLYYTLSIPSLGQAPLGDWIAEPRQLSRKKPPVAPKREETGSWDLCPWQPREVRV